MNEKYYKIHKLEISWNYSGNILITNNFKTHSKNMKILQMLVICQQNKLFKLIKNIEVHVYHFWKQKSTFSPIFHILLKKQMTIKRTHIYGQPKDLDYHLPWQWRSPSKLTRILSTKPFLYSYTLYVCRWRLLLRPQLESGRAKGFNPLQIRKYFNFK